MILAALDLAWFADHKLVSILLAVATMAMFAPAMFEQVKGSILKLLEDAVEKKIGVDMFSVSELLKTGPVDELDATTEHFRELLKAAQASGNQQQVDDLIAFYSKHVAISEAKRTE